MCSVFLGRSKITHLRMCEGNKHCPRCLWSLKMLDESSVCSHKVWVMLLICLWTSSDEHVAVSQQPACLWQSWKPQGQTCLCPLVEGPGSQGQEKNDTKQLNCRFLWELSHWEFVAKAAETFLQKYGGHNRTSWQVLMLRISVHFEPVVTAGRCNNEPSILGIAFIGQFGTSWFTPKSKVHCNEGCLICAEAECKDVCCNHYSSLTLTNCNITIP